MGKFDEFVETFDDIGEKKVEDNLIVIPVQEEEKKPLRYWWTLLLIPVLLVVVFNVIFKSEKTKDTYYDDVQGIVSKYRIDVMEVYEIKERIIYYSEKYRLDRYLIQAMIECSSKYEYNHGYYTESVGLMQIYVDKINTRERLTNVDYNINIGCNILYVLLKDHNVKDSLTIYKSNKFYRVTDKQVSDWVTEVIRLTRIKGGNI